MFNVGRESIFVEDDETFNHMLDAIKSNASANNVISFKSSTKPEFDVYLNIDNLIKNVVFYRLDNEILIVNDFIFTTSKAEYQGAGIFLSKKVYLLNQENMDIIKNALFEKVLIVKE